MPRSLPPGATTTDGRSVYHRGVGGQPNPFFSHRIGWRWCPWCYDIAEPWRPGRNRRA
jgi:hypothetical protein